MKYVDINAIVQVIGNIFLNPNLLDMQDKYTFSEEDFTEKFHKILFGSIYNLHALGTDKIDISTIEDYLEEKPKMLAIYKANRGSEYLKEISETVKFVGFDYYYGRMKKMTLLRLYESIGFDLSWLYDPDNLFDAKKKEIQEKWLDNSSLEDIADKIDERIDKIKFNYLNSSERETKKAGDNILELIQNLQESPDYGLPLYGKYINTITRGARLKKLYIRSASTGSGKALPNSTIIPTPQGDKKVGDVKVGDYLFDAFGNPTKVLKVFPQGEKEVWEVKFKDGRIAKCCNEHLWSYCTQSQREKSKKNRNFYTNTLQELSKEKLYQREHGYKILVPMQKAVKYETKNFYIKPYTFGLLLGDGSFRYNKTQKALSYSSENEELPNNIAKEMNWSVKKNSDFNYSWTFKWKKESNKNHENVWVEEVLKDYPELWNVKSEDKHIPIEYLEGDVQQRLDLLNGLLDSDGSVDKEKGRVSFYTISSRLKNDVIKLARSLGFKTSEPKDCHKNTNICYKIEIIGSPEDKIKLFKLNRKKDLILDWFNNGKRKESNLFNPIVSIKKLNYKEEMTCFYVNNKEHLFLMNDYIVTHNTRSMIADICNIGAGKLYNIESNSWIETGIKEPVLYITTEQELDEVQTMMLAFIANVNESHILYGRYEGNELERIIEAGKILIESEIYIEELPDFSLIDVENCIKKNIRNYNVHYVWFDYIHSSMKILQEVSSKTKVSSLREDNILFMLAAKLKDICNQYNIFILTATQVNGGYTTAQTYDQNLLRGAKSIADRADLGMIYLEASLEDEIALQNILTQYGFEMPKIKISVYKNRRGQYKGLLIWCKDNRGTCRIDPLFVTNYKYELINLEDIQINIIKEDNKKDIKELGF